MNQYTRLILALFIALFVIATASLPVLAAPSQPDATKATLTIKATIPEPTTFWNYTFLPKDGQLGKPATINLVWSVGNQSQDKTEAISFKAIPAGQFGQVTITTDKGTAVNLQLAVYDANKNKLGAISLQVLNKGQTESFTIASPEVSEPTISWSNY